MALTQMVAKIGGAEIVSGIGCTAMKEVRGRQSTCLGNTTRGMFRTKMPTGGADPCTCTRGRVHVEHAAKIVGSGIPAVPDWHPMLAAEWVEGPNLGKGAGSFTVCASDVYSR